MSSNPSTGYWTDNFPHFLVAKMYYYFKRLKSQKYFLSCYVFEKRLNNTSLMKPTFRKRMRRAGDGRVDVLLVDGVTHLGAVLLVALKHHNIANTFKIGVIN